MAKYFADLNGNMTEVQPLSEATVPYSTNDTITAARDNSGDANKMIQLAADGTIDIDFLPFRFITQGGTSGHQGMGARLDALGKWDISLMPIGVGAEVTVKPAAETLVGGNFCNIYSAGIRKADATTNAKKAHGFCIVGFASGATATIYGVSNKNTVLSGLTAGQEYWLSTTPGAITATAPSATGNWVQQLGTAESASDMVFSNAVFGWTKIAP